MRPRVGGGDDGAMHVLYEVHVAAGVDPARLLSAEVLEDTRSKLMTWEEAVAIGFKALPEPPAGRLVRYVGVAGGPRDAKFVLHVLENSPAATAIRTYEVA